MLWNILWDFSGGSDSEESAGNAGDLGSIPGSGRSLGEENGIAPGLEGGLRGNTAPRGEVIVK